MGEDEDYELVARDDLATLRKELEEVKRDPTKNYESSVTLIEAMDRLADQVSRLLELFERANKEMHEDYAKGVHKESEKLDTVIEQNKKLARAVLALADKKISEDTTSTKQPPKESTQQDYPLRGPEDLAEAPWTRDETNTSSDAHKSPSRRSLMREFR